MWKIWHKSVGSVPQPLRTILAILVFGGPVVVIGLIVLDMAGVLRQPVPPTAQGSDVTSGTICSGIDASKWIGATEDIRKFGGWDYPPVSASGLCMDAPRTGEMQIREMSNPSSEFPPNSECYKRVGCAVNKVGPDGRVKSAILYVDNSAEWRWCSYPHELLHIYPGLGHTESPMSIMYGTNLPLGASADNDNYGAEASLDNCFEGAKAWELITKQAVEDYARLTSESKK